MSEYLGGSIVAQSNTGGQITPLAGMPAVIQGRGNGCLTPNDIGMMIGDQNDHSIGIYLGEAPQYWASVLKGRTIYLFAAETDITADNGKRMTCSFNECVQHLWESPQGAKLMDPQTKHDRDSGAQYTSAVMKEILRLKPGERTGHMIPPLVIVGGRSHHFDSVVIHPHNMYALRNRGAFAKAAHAFSQNCGSNVMDTENSPLYLACDDVPGNEEVTSNICGVNFINGSKVRNERYVGFWSVRPFIALRAPEL